MAEEENPWNSLEVVKLLVSLLTPLTILGLTLSTNHRLQESNDISENNLRVYNYRENIYKEMGPMLNDLYCYHMYVGHWKELTPRNIISIKRTLDKLAYVNSPYFDQQFLGVYNRYMDACFLTHTRLGGNAKIKSEFLLHKDYYAVPTDTVGWTKSFADSFTGEDNRDSVFTTYNELLDLIANNLNLQVKNLITEQPDQKPPGKKKPDIKKN